MPKNRVKNVGVELEGGWIKPPQPLQRDGSLKFHDIVHYEAGRGLAGPAPAVAAFKKLYVTGAVLEEHKIPQVGEIVSPILEVPEVEDYIRTNYPNIVNETCGLHVHMSFKYKLNYQRLMTEDYTRKMVVGLIDWAKRNDLPKDHPLWPRLMKPNHNHCAHVYLGDNQVTIAGKDYNSRGTNYSRYTAINYCWAQHKTVECRLLSMFDTADQAVSAVGEVIRITNLFLSKIKSREKKFSVVIKRGATLVDHRRIRV